MKYLLDTNVLGELFRGNLRIRETLSLVGLSNCHVSEVSLAEILYGAYKGGIERHINEVEYVKQHFTILPISPCLNDFGAIKYDLEKRGNRIDNFDLLIAATAITSDLTLVTHNTKHFKCIPGLTVIDWEQE